MSLRSVYEAACRDASPFLLRLHRIRSATEAATQTLSSASALDTACRAPYTMEEIKLKIEGRGNGIKTVLLNLPSVSYSLKRSPDHILKFLGYGLGSQTKGDKNAMRYIVNGSHSVEEVQDHIYDFIDEYVMCRHCNNPETFYTAKCKKSVQRECYACGHRSRVEGKMANLVLRDLDGTPVAGHYHSLGGSIDDTSVDNSIE
ncbi:UNVERIFIED_CONTAM: hypothetical protein PYX00_010847 [Menopon gallinae]|uniref:Eukaryotic translation initiation factor 5 n=1 Tax=Menopon gallinae TaxID=328185 RepID=A0AAW2H6D7_9NEOP